ncbi:unnamed protein product [Closterium sp. NIES-54]
MEALELETLQLEVLALETLELEVLALGPDSPLPAPSPYAEQTESPSERPEPASRPASLVCAVCIGRRVPRLRPPPRAHIVDGMWIFRVLQRFGFRYSSPQSTPLPTGHSFLAPPLDEFVEPSGPYPELVGCLMYVMTCTRPDLAYPLSILARYVAPERHRPEHWEAAKRVLRYLCSTSGMGLVLGGRGPVVLTGHADASWVDDLATQQSS